MKVQENNSEWLTANVKTHLNWGKWESEFNQTWPIHQFISLLSEYKQEYKNNMGSIKILLHEKAKDFWLHEAFYLHTKTCHSIQYK